MGQGGGGNACGHICNTGNPHNFHSHVICRNIRLMKLLGAEILFLTNAAGGILQGMKAGDFMLITGQIASFVPSPLVGANIEELGTRFPDRVASIFISLAKSPRPEPKTSPILGVKFILRLTSSFP